MQSKGSGEPASIPLPKSWLDSLESNGVHINRLGSKISLYKYSLFCFCKGIYKVLLLLFQRKLQAQNDKPYAVFPDLSLNNLPVSGQNKSYDIISWYKQSKIKNPDIQEIWAQVREAKTHQIPPDIIVCRNIFPRFTKWSYYFKYFYKLFKAFIVACLNMIYGKWWYGLLFDESAYFHYVSVINDQDVAREYLFHHSCCIYKPLWTFEAEAKGSRVSLYFYSTNSEGFKYGEHALNSDYAFKLMKWNRIIVWDEQQRDHLKQYCPNAEYQIVGPIYFSDSNATINNYDSETLISIFNVTPNRPTRYTSLGYAKSPYFSPELTFNYFSDIALLKTINNATILWKKKRTVERTFINKGFSINLSKFHQEKKIIPVDPEISARSLIEKCDIVISMPFTSTAIIGKELGKPSIFYDASASIEKNESHGIPVLKNKEELKNWYRSLNIDKVVSS